MGHAAGAASPHGRDRYDLNQEPLRVRQIPIGDTHLSGVRTKIVYGRDETDDACRAGAIGARGRDADIGWPPHEVEREWLEVGIGGLDRLKPLASGNHRHGRDRVEHRWTIDPRHGDREALHVLGDSIAGPDIGERRARVPRDGCETYASGRGPGSRVDRRHGDVGRARDQPERERIPIRVRRRQGLVGRSPLEHRHVRGLLQHRGRIEDHDAEHGLVGENAIACDDASGGWPDLGEIRWGEVNIPGRGPGSGIRRRDRHVRRTESLRKRQGVAVGIRRVKGLVRGLPRVNPHRRGGDEHRRDAAHRDGSRRGRRGEFNIQELRRTARRECVRG